MVGYVYNLSTWEVEAKDFQEVQVSLNYWDPISKKKKKPYKQKQKKKKWREKTANKQFLSSLKGVAPFYYSISLFYLFSFLKIFLMLQNGGIADYPPLCPSY